MDLQPGDLTDDEITLVEFLFDNIKEFSNSMGPEIMSSLSNLIRETQKQEPDLPSLITAGSKLMGELLTKLKDIHNETGVMYEIREQKSIE